MAKVAVDRCPECREIIYFDDEAGHVIPHYCLADYIETAQEAFWAEDNKDA